ncbi:MAG TPA: hypothetical protein DCS66_14490 [Flavobacteriaceae bacterium]|jgi:hypothetical protein|nr:hypothetical protein [Flavobacteriaceae bacterium]HAT65776.1 hypothetical protein [Flavobacteriaceae bacterium]|tara:strand:+ start:176 stop:361 length:186 start_codon:yes stop_codon:yes gene_type:complete
MDNPFKKLVHPPKEAPEKLKEKVMADIAAFKLFKDFAGLFSSNYADAAESFFKKRRKPKNK